MNEAIAGLGVDRDRSRRDGHIAEADDFDAYLVEIHVLAGHFREARDVAALPLVRLADRSTEVVVLTVRRLVAVA